MKKLFAFAAIMVCIAGSKALSEQFITPEGNAQPAFMDYGGTKYSTGNFTVSHITATVRPAVLQAVYFSSGNAGAYDFVDVWDATCTLRAERDYGTTAPTIRLYNLSGSTSTGVAGNSITAGSSFPRYPIRMRKGIIWKPSSNSYNSLLLQYWQED